MLDGAAKNSLLFAEVERQGMPAVAMTDHGNMFGAYEFYQTSKNHAVKPIIGIEAYVAPSSRFSRVAGVLGEGRRPRRRQPRRRGRQGRLGWRALHAHDDVGAERRGTAQPVPAQLAGELRGLLHEAPDGPRADRAARQGHHRLDRLPVRRDPDPAAARPVRRGARRGGRLPRHLRRGQLLRRADGPRRRHRAPGAQRPAAPGQGPPACRWWSPTTPTTSPRTRPTPTTTCCASAWAATRTTRTGSGSTGRATTSRPPSRCGRCSARLPEAADNTLRIAEQVGDYSEVFAYVDRMPQFDVPEGETQNSVAAQGARPGTDPALRRQPAAGGARAGRDRTGVIEPLGFSSYFLIVSDICRYARENGIPVGPGRGSATGSMVAYLTRITELDPLEHQLLFETVPQPRADQPARRRPRLRRPPARQDGRLRLAEVRHRVHRPGEHVRQDQGEGRDQGRQPDPRLPVRPRRQDHQGPAPRRHGQGHLAHRTPSTPTPSGTTRRGSSGNCTTRAPTSSRSSTPAWASRA